MVGASSQHHAVGDEARAHCRAIRTSARVYKLLNVVRVTLMQALGGGCPWEQLGLPKDETGDEPSTVCSRNTSASG